MATKKRATSKAAAGPRKVTLVPVAGHWIPDVPAVEQTVSATRAKELLRYSPAAFTVKRTTAATKPQAKPAPANDTPAETPVAGEETV